MEKVRGELSVVIDTLITIQHKPYTIQEQQSFACDVPTARIKKRYQKCINRTDEYNNKKKTQSTKNKKNQIYRVYRINL